MKATQLKYPKRRISGEDKFFLYDEQLEWGDIMARVVISGGGTGGISSPPGLRKSCRHTPYRFG
jgi:hypothetical protein